MARIAKRIIPVLMIFSCFTTYAQNTTIQVIGVDKKPLANIVVYVESENKPTVSEDILSDSPIATMDQVNRQFRPHILVVNKNTKIDFPNSDKIKHHVYSFSAAKNL